MKILLTGGGTLGAVSPLLAIRDELQKRVSGTRFIWIGTEQGLEKEIIEREGINYYAISSGKLRRYFSWQNFLDPFRIIRGVFQAYKIIKEFDPEIILSAGGFVGVPVVIASWLQARKSIIHQQDLQAGLANLLVARFATIVTVSFKESLADFPKGKTALLGNPVREMILSGNREKAKEKFGFNDNLPVLLVMGGSLGAESINQLMEKSFSELTQFCQIIHVSGKEYKPLEITQNNYKVIPFLHYEELADAYALAEIIVCRAGLSTISELSAIGKPIVLIPIPNNQQVKNADYLVKAKAAMALDQNKTKPAEFVRLVRELIDNEAERKDLAENIRKIMPSNPREMYGELILSLIE